jgi:hypothetical protein
LHALQTQTGGTALDFRHPDSVVTHHHDERGAGAGEFDRQLAGLRMTDAVLCGFLGNPIQVRGNVGIQRHLSR